MSERPIYHIADLPQEAFDGGFIPVPDSMKDKAVFIEKIELHPQYGPLWHIQGEKFPRKGRMTPNLIKDIGIVKKYLKNWLVFFGSSPMRYFAVLVLILPSPIFKKIIKRWLHGLADFCWGAMSNHLNIKREWLSNSTREIYDVGMKVFGEWEFFPTTKDGERLVKTLCVALDGDSPYRFVMQDIFQLINTENAIKHPAKETQRLFEIFNDRDKEKMIKWKELRWAIKLLMLRKEIREPFIDCMKLLNPAAFNFDECDLSLFLQSGWYRPLGLTDGQMMELWNKIMNDNV